MKSRHFLLLLVVVVSLLGVGCAPARSEMNYLTLGGRGEVRGEMNGLEFSAVIEISPSGDCVAVEYHSPEALSSLKMTAQGETCRVKLGDVDFVCDVDEVGGFLQPVTAFLPYVDAKTVQKEGENTVLTFPTGGKLTLSPKGYPVSFEGEGIALEVVWWEMGTEQK